MEETVEVEQQLFIPAKIPKAKHQHIEVAKLRGCLRRARVEPSDLFVINIREMGILFPLLVFRTGKGTYRVADGLRRLKSAVILGIKKVPCFVYADESTFRNAVTLAANNHRSSNPLAEVKAIVELLKNKSASVHTVAEELGIPLARVKKRMELTILEESLKDIVFAGKVSTSIAQVAAKLPQFYQKKLAEMYRDKGALTMADVIAIKDSRRKAAVAQLPASIFTMPSPSINHIIAIPDTMVQALMQMMVSEIDDFNADGGNSDHYDVAQHVLEQLKDSITKGQSNGDTTHDAEDAAPQNT